VVDTESYTEDHVSNIGGWSASGFPNYSQPSNVAEWTATRGFSYVRRTLDASNAQGNASSAARAQSPEYSHDMLQHVGAETTSESQGQANSYVGGSGQGQ